MNRTRLLTIMGLVVCLFLCCSNDDNGLDNNCDLETIISRDQFETAPSDFVTINDFEIEGDCLRINYSASGCDGDRWVLQLIDFGAVHESNPPQRDLRLTVITNEDCLSYITQELTFDISNLQGQESPIILNITNSDESILYEY